MYRRGVPAPRRYVTDAIVLSRFDFGEADRILTLITPGGGKIKAIAKGIRRQKSRIGGSLEPFAELRVVARPGPDLRGRHPGLGRPPWLNLRDDLVSFGTASYLAELANGTLEERHAAESVYLLLKRAYEILDAGMAPGRVARWFEMHLADELGVRPEVDRCVECGRLLEADERYRWLPPLGGVLCERCPGPPFERAGLSLAGLKLLKAYQRQDVEALAALRLSPEVEREVEIAMREFLAYSLDRRPRSLAFLDEVRTGAARRRRPGSGADGLMPAVELRDIVTDADRAAAVAIERGPGQEQFVASVQTSLEEAELYPEACARYWAIYDGRRDRGLRDDQRRHPRGDPRRGPDAGRAVLPVAPLIDAAAPAAGLRRRPPRRHRGLRAEPPRRL